MAHTLHVLSKTGETQGRLHTYVGPQKISKATMIYIWQGTNDQGSETKTYSIMEIAFPLLIQQ